MHRSAKAHTARWRLDLRSVRFKGQILAERRQCGKFVARGGHVGALTHQIVCNRPPQAAIRNVMRRVSCGRQIAARDLVLALRAGLDARYFMGDRIVDRLIIAELEVQEWVMPDRAPMTSEQ